MTVSRLSCFSVNSGEPFDPNSNHGGAGLERPRGALLLERTGQLLSGRAALSACGPRSAASTSSSRWPLRHSQVSSDAARRRGVWTQQLGAAADVSAAVVEVDDGFLHGVFAAVSGPWTHGTHGAAADAHIRPRICMLLPACPQR